MFPAIALGGGGVRGFLLVGALQRLAQVQKLEFPQGI
jgi:predicted acylesterase/phospholipase RssA